MNIQTRNLITALALAAVAVVPTACRKNVETVTPQLPAATTTDAAAISKLRVTGITSPASSSYSLANLTDGSLTTYWSAENNSTVYLPDPNSQYVTFRLDTTSMQLVSYIKMAFFTGGNKTIQYSFDVLVSQDGQTGWVTLIAGQKSGAGNTALQTFDFPDTKGKFVRIVGHGNNGAYPKANSWTEVEIYGAPAPQAAGVKLNISASQVTTNNYVSPYVAANAVDGNLHTNWTSKMSGTDDYKYLEVTLPTPQTLDYVKLSFYTGGDPKRVSRFGIFISKDGQEFTKVMSNTYSASSAYGERLETFDFPDATVKVIRIYCYGHTGTYSPTTINSINELELWAPSPSSLCKITSIVEHSEQAYTDQRTGYFYYNSLNLLDSLSFKQQTLTAPGDVVRWVFSYDGNHQLASMQLLQANNFPSISSWDETHYYTWKNGRIAFERTDFASLGYASRTIDSVVYDPQGRVIADYRQMISDMMPDAHYEPLDTLRYSYNADGNRIYPGTTLNYDAHVNFLRSDPMLMFLYRDYSKNNPVYARGYTSQDLPTGFSNGLDHLLPYYFFDSKVLSDITYQCN